MKAKLTLFTVLSLCASTWADVTLVQKVEGPAGKENITMRVKNGQVRTDVGEKLSTIINTETGDTVTMMHGTKNAMRVSGTQIKQMQEALAKQGGDTVKPIKTGETEKVGEYTCDIWTIEMQGVKSKFWVARDYPNYEAIKKDMDLMSKGLGQGMDTTDFGGMVVRVDAETQGQVSRVEMQSVKLDPIDDTIFVLPKDYKEVSMPVR